MDAFEIGSFLGELRKQKDLKQKEVAEALQVSDKAISRWETGRGIPDVDSLQRLSEFYEVSINEILAGRRIEKNEVEKVADQNLKVAVKKQSTMKKKLLSAVAAVILLLILLVALLLAFAPVSVVSVSFVREYRVSGDDGMENLEKAFRIIEDLEEKDIDHTISMRTRQGENYIEILVILSGEPHFLPRFLHSHPESMETEGVLEWLYEVDGVAVTEFMEELKEIGYW